MNKNGSIIIGILVTLAIIFIGISAVFFIQSSQNKAIVYEEQVRDSWSLIDVHQKRRVDLLYNLADAVQSYNDHEANVFRETIKARSGAMTTRDVQVALGAVYERYPELKSAVLYKQLMTEIQMTENKISQVRDSYNKSIKEYNRYVRKFPTRIFLDILGYEKVDFDYLKYDAPADAPRDLFVNQSKARDEYNAQKNK